MPIGSKSYYIENKLEWRLSFSQAEPNLVYSITLTQFLCYGIMKIFMKKVLCSKNEESLICSYFMKTVLFWEIQGNTDNTFWSQSNLLNCFSVCFKRLCKCVFDSYCPNFFIPENNMFKNKIDGSICEALLSQLIGYYELDESCLLLSPTLRSILGLALCSPYFVIPFSEGHGVSLEDLNKCIKREIHNTSYMFRSLEQCYVTLKSITKLFRQPLSQFQLLTLQHNLAVVLVHLAFF